MDAIIQFDSLKIYLPDGDSRSFFIYGDLRSIMKVTWQGDAVKQLRKAFKEIDLKPEPKIFYEESSVSIRSQNPEVIISVLNILIAFINLISSEDVNSVKAEEIFKHIKLWKAPKRQKWKIGDVFSLMLKDGSFTFGQILGEHPTVALFAIKKNEETISIGELSSSSIVTIIHCTPNNLNNHSWKVVANYQPLGDKDSGVTGSDSFRIGQRSFSATVLESICRYYWFNICSWEREDDLKELLLVHQKN